jgi:2-polyprenyl-6-methoxyphenol hydroxylase-like FAD-dependent oxidoreductase
MEIFDVDVCIAGSGPAGTIVADSLRKQVYQLL